jgi:hypothetical protein
MESHAVSSRLHDNRQRLRALLLPDAATGRIEADVFPRSTVMQLLCSARARRVAMTVVSLFLMFRRRGISGLALWPQLARSLGGLLRARWH